MTELVPLSTLDPYCDWDDLVSLFPAYFESSCDFRQLYKTINPLYIVLGNDLELTMHFNFSKTPALKTTENIGKTIKINI